MIQNISECKGCFSKEVCSIAAMALEPDIEREYPAGTFQVFKEIQARATKYVREYFKKFIECSNLEQSAEKSKGFNV